MVLKGPSEILVLLVNLGNGILINLFLSFPSSLTSQHYFLQILRVHNLKRRLHPFLYLLIASIPQSPKLLTKAEFGEVLSGTFTCSDRRCCNYLLISDHYTFKNVQITFELKNRFTCDSFNLIYVVICGTCKEEYIGETGEGKTKLRDRVRVYRQHIQQLHYQQLKVEGYLRVCGNGEFRIFPLLQMRLQDTNLR